MSELQMKMPKGVSRNGNSYQAAVRHDGVRYYLGTFRSPEAAAEAYRAFRLEHPRPSTKWLPGDPLRSAS